MQTSECKFNYLFNKAVLSFCSLFCRAAALQDGYMVSAGDPTRVYLDSAVRHVMLRQGVLGIKVRAPA